MANNFKRTPKNHYVSTCNYCKLGIYEPRDKGQYRWNEDPRCTGFCHNSCITHAAKQAA